MRKLPGLSKACFQPIRARLQMDVTWGNVRMENDRVVSRKPVRVDTLSVREWCPYFCLVVDRACWQTCRHYCVDAERDRASVSRGWIWKAVRLEWALGMQSDPKGWERETV